MRLATNAGSRISKTLMLPLLRRERVDEQLHVVVEEGEVVLDLRHAADRGMNVTSVAPVFSAIDFGVFRSK